MPLEAKFIHGDDQERCDYTPGSAVVAGKVVVFPNYIGVVTNPQGIAANVLGSLATNGVFEFTKAGATVFAAGGPVSWDDTNKLAVAPGVGMKPIGYAVLAAGNGPTKVQVRINKSLLGATP